MKQITSTAILSSLTPTSDVGSSFGLAVLVKDMSGEWRRDGIGAYASCCLIGRYTDRTALVLVMSERRAGVVYTIALLRTGDTPPGRRLRLTQRPTLTSGVADSTKLPVGAIGVQIPGLTTLTNYGGWRRPYGVCPVKRLPSCQAMSKTVQEHRHMLTVAKVGSLGLAIQNPGLTAVAFLTGRGGDTINFPSPVKDLALVDLNTSRHPQKRDAGENPAEGFKTTAQPLTNNGIVGARLFGLRKTSLFPPPSRAVCGLSPAVVRRSTILERCE